MRLERDLPPLARRRRPPSGEGQRAASSVGRSAEQLALQVGAAASQMQGQVGAVSAAGVTTLAQVQRSAEARGWRPRRCAVPRPRIRACA
ncbi:MAG: hypothetical protein U1F67_14670 [Rubrivivax sp.]